MKKKNKLLFSIGFMFLIAFGCNFGNTMNIEKTSSSPSVLSSPSPIPTGNVADFEKYCYRVLCNPIEKNIVPKLNSPIDIAVTNDGKTVYVLNKRNYLNECGIVDTKEFIDRQFIYKISEIGKISIIKTQDGYPTSCTLSEQIETDKDDNVYVSSPVIDTNAKIGLTPVTGQKIIKITNETNSSVIGDIKLPFNISPTSIPPTIINLGHLDVSKDDNSVNFSLVNSSRYSSGEQTINRLKSISEFEKLFSVGYGNTIPPFIVKNNKIYFGFNYTDFFSTINEEQKYKEFIHLDKPTVGPTRIEFNSKGEIIGTISMENKICKIVPNDKVYFIAGSGNAGFKDGKGEEAEFNNPVGLDIDGQDNIYVADMGNNAIRKITPDGIVSTIYKESNLNESH